LKPSSLEIPLAQPAVFHPDIAELKRQALEGLVPMLDPAKRAFCARLVETAQSLVPEGISQRYTIMTILGLHEIDHAGGQSLFDTKALFEATASDLEWVDGAGDLGLMIWMFAKCAPERLEDLFQKINLQSALDRFEDARHERTMELSWFLAGLAHASLACPSLVPALEDLAVEAYRRLKGNQGDHGFFGHMSTRKSAAGIIRGRVGSFADQVYPIYAMSKFAMAFSVDEPLCSATDCARAICSAQGDLGQWCWLYDSKTGRVSSRYPVYSVHQHGMAPMGLFALQEAIGESFAAPIEKGLRWIYGFNELGADMRGHGGLVVWRCIRPRNTQTKYWETALSLIRQRRDQASMGELEVLREIRPYEFGWLLYAFASVCTL
jgi:hypothetical protein